MKAREVKRPRAVFERSTFPGERGVGEKMLTVLFQRSVAPFIDSLLTRR